MSKEPSSQEKSIVILGAAGVGKTCFLDMFVHGRQWVDYSIDIFDATQRDFTPRRTLTISGKHHTVTMQDLSLAPLIALEPGFRLDIFEDILSKADGIVFMYDITDARSYGNLIEHAHDLTVFSRKRYGDDGREYPAGSQRFGGVLVGTKVDVADANPFKREVEFEEASEEAAMNGWQAFEVDTSARDTLDEVVGALLKDIEKVERWDAEELKARGLAKDGKGRFSGLKKAFSFSSRDKATSS